MNVKKLMKIRKYLINFFGPLLLTNCFVFGASLAGAEPTYWTYVMTVCFSFGYATIMHWEHKITL